MGHWTATLRGRRLPDASVIPISRTVSALRTLRFKIEQLPNPLEMPRTTWPTPARCTVPAGILRGYQITAVDLADLYVADCSEAGRLMCSDTESVRMQSTLPG